MHIFVGNLAFTATETEVRQLFEGYGIVERVRLMTDRETGQPRGVGFVEMSHNTHARAAIAGLDGANLGGRISPSIRHAHGTSGVGPRRGPRW